MADYPLISPNAIKILRSDEMLTMVKLEKKRRRIEKSESHVVRGEKALRSRAVDTVVEGTAVFWPVDRKSVV